MMYGVQRLYTIIMYAVHAQTTTTITTPVAGRWGALREIPSPIRCIDEMTSPSFVHGHDGVAESH